MIDEKDLLPEARRRDLLKLAGLGLGAASFGGAAVAQEAPMAGHAHGMHPMGQDGVAATPPAVPVAEPRAYVFLNLEESAFIEAAVDTFIPEDEYGPSGAVLGVSIFVDRQLDGGYGRGERMYRQGPFLEGTPEQGYQSPLTPGELVRIGIADVNAHTQKNYKGSSFYSLDPDDRVAVLTALQRNQVKLDTVPTGAFFGVLFQLVMDGYFADPVYGGNKGKASWKMLGYPGIGEMYADKIGPWRNRPYVVENPLSMQDLA